MGCHEPQKFLTQNFAHKKFNTKIFQITLNKRKWYQCKKIVRQRYSPAGTTTNFYEICTLIKLTCAVLISGVKQSAPGKSDVPAYSI